MNTFATDLNRGIEVEQKTLKLFQKDYPCATLINAFKGYDIWIPELHQSVEVKYDPMSNETGNIVIEIEFNGKPSALMTTTATWWVFCDDWLYVKIRPKQIIQCIFDQRLQYATFTGLGDTKSKKAFLVRKEVLFEYGEIIQDNRF